MLGDAGITFNQLTVRIQRKKEYGKQRKLPKKFFGIYIFLNKRVTSIRSANTFTYIIDIWLPESLPDTEVRNRYPTHNNKEKIRHELSAHSKSFPLK